MRPDRTLLLSALACELRQARTELESLSVTLCADFDVVTRHASALQTLDSVAQRQTAIADLLVQDDPASAVRMVNLEGLRDRLVGLLEDTS